MHKRIKCCVKDDVPARKIGNKLKQMLAYKHVVGNMKERDLTVLFTQNQITSVTQVYYFWQLETKAEYNDFESIVVIRVVYWLTDYTVAINHVRRHIWTFVNLNRPFEFQISIQMLVGFRSQFFDNQDVTSFYLLNQYIVAVKNWQMCV